MSKNEDFGKYLHEKYPCIFNQELWVECNQGWYDLIDKLSSDISAFCETLSTKYSEKPLMNVVQIKEKFGGLRYYVDYNVDREDITPVETLIRDAENKSYDMCEDCGAAGERCAPSKYWMKTLCHICQDKYEMGDTPNGI
jgi:hypothetical protein